MKSDNFNTSNVVVDPNHCKVKCVSWSAVATGALIAVSLSFIFNMLSIGIGLAAFASAPDASATSFAVGGFIGLVIFAILAMFPAGYIAGLLGHPSCTTRKMGEIHGAAAWGLALIITMLMTSSVAQFVSQTGYLVNRHQVIEVRMTQLPNNEVVSNMGHSMANTNTVQIDPEKAAAAASSAAFATFFIFFIGFIAACFGGHCGMMCKKRRMLRNGLQ